MATISGGDKLAKRLAEITARLSNHGTLAVGFLEGATYPNGTPVAMIAAIQDFGAPSRGIPPRPFFRNMIAKRSPGWPKALAAFLKANNYDTQRSLDQMGELIADQLQQSIHETNTPPLAPATIARKGFSKPLIHHADMLNAVDFEVT